jgi:hypothetical protein
VDLTLLVAWRVWHARNEVTHDKPLPSIASSINFLLSYFKLMHDVKNFPTEINLKGKQLAVASVDPVPAPRCAPIAPWCNPLVGFVKLSVDGSFKNGSARSATILRDEGGSIILFSCKYIADGFVA